MKDGLKDKFRKKLIDIMSSNERVDKIILFGSRAMGSFTSTSDVDICLFGDKLTLTDHSDLAHAIEKLSIPQQVDLVRRATINNKELIEHIQKHGVTWWEKQAKI